SPAPSALVHPSAARRSRRRHPTRYVERLVRWGDSDTVGDGTSMTLEQIEAPTGSADERTALALYLHIPFCTAKCGYCDFNSYEGLDHLVPDYTPALIRELELWAPAA